MGKSTKIDLNLAADTGTAWIHQKYPPQVVDQPENLPTFVGFASAQVVVSFPTVKDEFDSSFSLKLLGGYDTLSSTQVSRSSPLSGPFDRAYYLLSRANLIKDHFGVYEAFFTGTFKTPGLSFFAGLFPQESKVYPYHFNSAVCAVGDFKWDCSTSRSNPHDNTVWTNPYTKFIGPIAGLEWEPPFLKGFKANLQTGTDFTPLNARNDKEGNFKRSITTAQVAYGRNYKIGGVPSKTLGTFFYSYDKPAVTKTAQGEEISPTQAIGLYAQQIIEKFQFSAGYGFNTNRIEDPAIQIVNRTHSMNLGACYSFLNHRLILGALFAGVWFSSEENSSLIKNQTDGSEYTVDFSATGALWQGLSATLGWNGFIADSSKQAQLNAPTFRSAGYLFLNYNFSHSWGGG